MKGFVIPLLGVIFVTLIAGSVQSITADHLEPGQGIFKDKVKVEVVTTHDSNYQVYLQTVLRNGDGQLISVTEGMHGFVITHKITDNIFDTLMGKKEIVTINNIEYEKVQYIFSPTLVQRTVEMYPIFEEISIKFEVEEDTLAQMKEKIKDYYRWKIHYCVDFSSIGHDGFQCIPVFQAFTVVELVTQTDVVTHQWTILRELD